MPNIFLMHAPWKRGRKKKKGGETNTREKKSFHFAFDPLFLSIYQIKSNKRFLLYCICFPEPIFFKNKILYLISFVRDIFIFKIYFLTLSVMKKCIHIISLSYFSFLLVIFLCIFLVWLVACLLF